MVWEAEFSSVREALCRRLAWGFGEPRLAHSLCAAKHRSRTIMTLCLPCCIFRVVLSIKFLILLHVVCQFEGYTLMFLVLCAYRIGFACVYPRAGIARLLRTAFGAHRECSASSPGRDSCAAFTSSLSAPLSRLVFGRHPRLVPFGVGPGPDPDPYFYHSRRQHRSGLFAVFDGLLRPELHDWTESSRLRTRRCRSCPACPRRHVRFFEFRVDPLGLGWFSRLSARKAVCAVVVH